MRFKVTSACKALDSYEVRNEAGEVMNNITAYQIVQVMLKGHEVVNARFIKKGIEIKTESGIVKATIPNMPRDMAVEINRILEAERIKSLQKKEEQKIAQPTQKVQRNGGVIIDLGNSPDIKVNNTNKSVVIPKDRTKIQSNNSKAISFKGTLFRSEEQLCKKYNKDYKEFIQLRVKGYSIEESLGLKPLRPASELVPLATQNKVLDRLAYQRGEY